MTPPTDPPREAAAMSDCQLAESERLGDYTKLGTFGDMAEAIRNLVSEVRRLRAASAPPLPTAADVETRAKEWEFMNRWACESVAEGERLERKAIKAFIAGARSEAERIAVRVAELQLKNAGLQETLDASDNYKRFCEMEKLVGKLTADRDRLAAELRQAREALKPFADVLKGNYSHQGDNFFIVAGAGPSDLRFTFNLSQFRKAAAALDAAGQEGK